MKDTKSGFRSAAFFGFGPENLKRDFKRIGLGLRTGSRKKKFFNVHFGSISRRFTQMVIILGPRLFFFFLDPA